MDHYVPTQMIKETVRDSAWDAWDFIVCPIMVVRGEWGALSEAEAQRMQRMVAHARVETIEAGLDPHLDNPAAWREVLSTFLSGLT